MARSLEELCEVLASCCGVPSPALVNSMIAAYICDSQANPAPGADCTTPLFVTLCETLNPVPTCSITSYCNADGFVECKKLCIVDGVEEESTLITTVECPGEDVDAEINLVCNAATGFLDEIITIFDADGAQVGTPIITATTYECPPDKISLVPGCSSQDGRFLIQKINNTTGVVTICESDGITEVTDGSQLVSCDVEIKTLDDCFQDISDPSIRYKRITCIKVSQDTTDGDVTILWLDSSGAVLTAAPTNIEPCAAVKQDVEVEIDCAGTTSTESVDLVVAIAGSTNPIPVYIKEECADKVEVLVDVECDETTQNWAYFTTAVTNGVAAAPTIVDSGIACTEDKPDFEVIEECRLGTLHQVLYGIAPDGTSTEISATDTLISCPEKQKPDCVESQEWTYALDNTGTAFSEDNTIRITLSDGTFFDFNQPPAAGWTPQMAIWGAEIQAAADAAGLAWFVETRFRNPSNPSDLSGGGGFSGPPSLSVSLALTSMAWRYVNIQICPGQPTPVAAEIIDSSNPARIGFDLTTDGPVKGPLQRFFVCRECGENPVWYLEDGVTEAAAGQIPDCYEPCGTLALVDAPPESDCEFQTLIGCDNNNSTLTIDFIPDITRRAKICNGEQISVDYFQADPLDPNALIPYTLVGIFVDCATGEPVPLPEQPCAEFNTIECPPFEIYPKPLTDSGRDLTQAENDLLPFNDTIRNFAPWIPAWISVPPFPVFGITDVAPGTAVTGGYNDGAGNIFRTRVFPLGLTEEQIPACGDGTAADEVEINIQLQITGNHTVPGTGDDIFIYLMDGADTAPNLLDTIALVGAPLLGTNIYTLSSTVPVSNLSELRFALSLQTLESNTRAFNWDVEIFEVGITVDGCQVDCVRYVHDQCATNQRKSGNDLLYQIAQNTRPVAEPVVPCSDFLLTDLFSLAGVDGELRNREWDLGPRPTTLMSEEDGRAIINSFDFSAVTTIDGPWNNLGVNDTSISATIQDAQVIEGYVVVDEPTLIRYTGTSAGYFRLEVGECCGDLSTKIEGATIDATVNPTSSYTYPAGVHAIRMWNIDDWSNTDRSLQYSTDGGVTWITDNTPPNISFSRTKPVETCRKVKVCKDTGALIDLLSDEVLDPADLYVCSKLCSEEIGLLQEIITLLKADDSCPCDNGCILMEAFDIDRGIGDVGDTTTFLINLDGNLQSTVVHDYTTTSDGVNVSSFYTPIIAAINAVPGWSISLHSDIPVASQGKPTWKVEYTGAGASQLVIDKDSGGSVWTLDADGMGGIVGSTNWGTDSFPYSDC